MKTTDKHIIKALFELMISAMMFYNKLKMIESFESILSLGSQQNGEWESIDVSWHVDDLIFSH